MLDDVISIMTSNRLTLLTVLEFVKKHETLPVTPLPVSVDAKFCGLWQPLMFECQPLDMSD